MGKHESYKTIVWRPFRRDAYHWAWHDKKLFGIMREFRRDLRRCHERIWKGYCDYDIFSIDDWFLGIMPTMLQEFKDTQHGCPTAPGLISHRVFLEESDKEKDEDLQAWNAVLDRMIFLLKEADEEACTRENPYEEEYLKAYGEFVAKYGAFGEKLMTERNETTAETGRGNGCIPSVTWKNTGRWRIGIWRKKRRLPGTVVPARMKHWSCFQSGFTICGTEKVK